MTKREARKPKGIYCKWSKENLTEELAVIKDGVHINEAARRFNIPQTTLKRYNKGENPVLVVPVGRPPDLPREIEEDLVQHLLQLERMFFGLTRKAVMELAYDIAKRNGLKTRFCDDKKGRERMVRSFYETLPSN